MAMKVDPTYNAICQKFMRRSGIISQDTFARAWFKLTHRDMGPQVPTTLRPRRSQPRI